MAEERRWLGHISFYAIATAFISVVVRAAPVSVAVLCAEGRSGLLKQPWLSEPAAWVLTVVLLDLSRFAMHYAHHQVPVLWRLHRVHHSDPDLDLTTGLRAHPLEMLIHQVGELVVVAILAPPLGAVILTQCLFCFQTLFAHANAGLPPRLEAVLRSLVVTPDMHRIHHSDQEADLGRNFGDIFSWWDRLFRTYLHAPAAGQDRLVPGLRGFQADRSLGLWFMLTFPFIRASVPDAPPEASA